MGGVDRGDQMSGSHPFPHRCFKWYMQLFNHVIEVSLVNARILYNLTHEKSVPAEEFRKSVIDALVQPHLDASTPARRLPLQNVPCRPDRLTGRHFIAQHPVKKPDCVVCSDRKSKRRKQTSYYCSTCPESPPLCILPCFEKFHTTYKYK